LVKILKGVEMINFLWILAVIISVIYAYYIIINKIQSHFKLLEDISDDINEIRMKLGLGREDRTENQRRRTIGGETEQYLVAGKGIEEIKDLCFPEFRPGDSEESRKKYDKFIRGLIKDFNEAMICPQCKHIFYAYNEIDGLCFCKSGDNNNTKLITTSEYKKRLSNK
jgi:hypothetical protein